MSKLTDIARGWYLFAKANPKDKPLILERLEICDECPSKEQISEFGEHFLHAINKTSSVYKCGHCQCPLAPKAADPLGKCPIHKW
jgi:hypothetical protein